MREHSLTRGASQSAVRRRWLNLCTVWPSNSQISSFSKVILDLGKVRSRREPNVGYKGADRPGWCDALPTKKKLHESCRMGRSIVVMKLICSLDHCECDGHTLHKRSQRRLTADWLALRESDFSRMHRKVSSDWLPGYIKATRPVLEIFKMAGYFPDRPRTLTSFYLVLVGADGYCCTWSHWMIRTHSVGLLWTRDRTVTETSTWQLTTFTTERHPWSRRDSNPQYYSTSDYISTTRTARPLGSGRTNPRAEMLERRTVWLLEKEWVEEMWKEKCLVPLYPALLTERNLSIILPSTSSSSKNSLFFGFPYQITACSYRKKFIGFYEIWQNILLPNKETIIILNTPYVLF